MSAESTMTNPQSGERRRFLVCAYGCEPGKGSEQGVGWHWSLELAKLGNVVVLTRANNEPAIRAALENHVGPHPQFEFYDLPPVLRRWKRKEKGLYFYYLLWQWGAYRRARELHRAGRFHYVVQLTFGSIWMPTFMHRLDARFIWGPIGGGEAVPLKMICALPPRGRLVQYARHLLMRTAPVNPFLRRVSARASAVLARTEDTARIFPAAHRGKVHVVLETAIAVPKGASGEKKVHDGPLRVIYTGRLVPFKNVAAGIRAIALATQRGADLHFSIVGDGPSRDSLEALTSRLGIADRVTFRGTVSSNQVFEELKHSDVYLFPSLREGGVWSLMEAMAMGLPPICVRTSGMEIITDSASAIRIEPVSQERLVEEFATALLELQRSTERRIKLGENARRRMDEHFRWEHKGEFMARLCQRLEQAER
jgi:glycosyltransferase involved in cell wall biosynthesis